MLPEYFAVVGAVIGSLGGFIYLYDTIRGTAKPNRVTWLLWGVIPMITFTAQRIQGVEGVSWVSFAAGLTPLLIFCASFLNKEAYWKTTRLDYLCMAGALLGVVLWLLTRDADLAIVLSIVADFAAGLPTVRKAFRHPETESWRAYAVSTLGFGMSLLAVHTWNFANYSFVVYILAMNGALALLTVRGRNHQGRRIKN